LDDQDSNAFDKSGSSDNDDDDGGGDGTGTFVQTAAESGPGSTGTFVERVEGVELTALTISVVTDHTV
jgi:hypothetical protein